MKHINDTSDMCPECTGSGESCGEACHLCWGSGKYSGNSRMLDTPKKPTYEEQLVWLDLVGMMAQSSDKEMIKSIKENVIAVRNYEKAELNQALDNIHVNWMKFKTYAESGQNVDAYKEAMGLDDSPCTFVFRADKLNPREESLIDNRIKKLQAELQFELSRKKQFRSKQAIDHCHTAINNLKKWKSQSL